MAFQPLPTIVMDVCVCLCVCVCVCVCACVCWRGYFEAKLMKEDSASYSVRYAL